MTDRTRNIVQRLAVVALLSVLPAASAIAARAETPTAVAAAAKNGLAEIKPLLLILEDAQNVLNKMESDAAWQKACFEFAQRKDTAGLAAFVQRAAPHSTVEVLSVADWTATFSFHAFGKKVDICASNERGCEGDAVGVTIHLR